MVVSSACVECPHFDLNILSSVQSISKLQCRDYLYSVDLQNQYDDISQDNIPDCLMLKSLEDRSLYIDIKTMTYSCYCPPGRTDLLSVDDKGLLKNLNNYDLQNINCNTKCSVAYFNIMRHDVRDMCACVNVKGCTFTQRTLLTTDMTLEKTMNAIMILPNDLLFDSTITYCFQFSPQYIVDTNDIMTCELAEIEYIFSNYCPVECFDSNLICSMDTRTQRCLITCAHLHTMVYINEKWTCIPDLECDPHEFSHLKKDKNDRIIDITCKKCDVGSHKIDTDDKYTCTPCDKTHFNILPGTACEKCPENFISNSSLCLRCEGIPEGKILKEFANDCADVECRNGIDNAICEANVQNMFSFCGVEGYGWNIITQRCDVCKLNFISVDKGETFTNYLCVACDSNFFTLDIAQSKCLSCSEGKYRLHDMLECDMCEKGKYFNTHTHICQNCAQGTINSGKQMNCSSCNISFYASDSIECKPCSEHTIRQNISHCGKCELYYYANQSTGACEPCNVPSTTICVKKSQFLDDCSDKSISPCVCGCRECEWYKYIFLVDFFELRPNCQPGCKSGYKFVNGVIPKCISNYMIMNSPEYKLYNNGIYKLKRKNSLDFSTHECTSFLNVSFDVIRILNMKPCVSSTSGSFNIENTILQNFVADTSEYDEIKQYCSFCCNYGYILFPSMLGEVQECVKCNDCDPYNNCGILKYLQPTYKTNRCIEKFV